MAEEIEIICTVEELVDYANPATRTFAANFSVGMKGTAAPAQPLTQALLQPWNWELTGLALWAQTSATDPTKTLKPQPVATQMKAPMLEGTSLDVLKAGMSSQFQTALGQAKGGYPLFAWDPMNPGAPPATSMLDGNGNLIPRWPEFLGHASTFPAPLPHNLNLVVFFQVQTSSLQGAALVLVAPTFRVRTPAGATVTYAAPTATPVGPPPPPVTAPPTPPPPTPQQGFRWDYATGQGDTSGCIVAAHQIGLPIASYPFPAANAANAVAYAQIGPGAAWIKPELEFGNEDWRTTLETRLTETFDLGRQVLSVLRDPLHTQIPDPKHPGLTMSPPPAMLDIFGGAPMHGDVELLRQALLAILRDAADWGLRYTPDGSNLFEYVLHQMIPPADFDVNAFLPNAVAKLQASNMKTTLADPKATTDGNINDWQQTLAAIPGVDIVAVTAIPPVPVQVGSVVTTADSPYAERDFSNLLRSLASLQKLLAKDATLASMLYTAWNAVLASDASTAKDWGTIRTLVQSQLNALAEQTGGLRKRMLLANLGGNDAGTLTTWNQLIDLSGTGSETDQIRANIAKVLPAYFSSRTSTTPERLPALPSNVSTKALAFLRAGIQSAGKAAQSIVPTNVTDVQPSPTAQPVVLRVHPTAQPASDADDPLRGIAGVCLLLCEQAPAGATAKPWSCINVAELDVLDAMNPMTYDDDTTGPSPVVAEDVTFVPHRLITRNGIPQTALSYDNRPLAAPSPADDLTTYFKPTRNPEYGAIFEYSHVNKAAATAPSSTIGAWAKMSGLKFGRSYDAIAFVVRNSGALPRLLADLNAPNATTGTQTVLPTAPVVPLSPDAFARAAPPAAIAPFTYLRRTPVGQVRIRIADGTGYLTDLNQQSLPVIPPTVAPLAREADILNMGPQPAPTSTAGKLPLLMLWDSSGTGKPRNSYAFDVRPPAADPSVWDRWVAGMADDDSYRGTRAAVATDFALHAPKNMQDPSISSSNAISGKDITVNDPAVTHVCFNLTPVYPAHGSLTNVGQPRCVPVSQLLKNLPDTAIQPDAGFNQVQGKLAAVTVSMDNNASASLSVVGSAVTITVPAGQVWKLTMAPAIDPASKGVFDVDATRSQFVGDPITYQNPGTDATSTVQLIPSASPMEMLVECAQPSTLTAQDLWQSMQFAVPDGVQTTSLTLSLTPKSGDGWHLLRRIEVARQAWRWMGRPIFPDGSFPAMPAKDLNGIVPNGDSNDPLPALTSALNWEIQAFAERDYDASLTETSVIFPAGTPTDGSAKRQIHMEELASDLRAHYFRFGARMWSRYEGLPGFQPFKATTDPSIEAKVSFNKIKVNGALENGGYTTWTRAFVPCRVAQGASLPKPKILLCLPLTAAASAKDPTGTTSILVIADEPWYQVAGLAEKLVASIEEVTLKQSPQDLQMQQFGPDPILSTNDWKPIGAQQPLPAAPSAWFGTPIGTTFDDASTAPLLSNTCFQFRLSDPAFPGTKQSSPLDWYMAKLQFQRVITPDLVAIPVGGTVPNPWASSSMTDGVWVQILPSSNHFTTLDKITVDVNNITFKADSNNQIELTESKLGTVSLQAGPVSGGHHLLLWGLLMRNIRDAAGLPGEAYVGLYNFTDPKPVANAMQADTLYLIEVQSTPNAQKGTTWLGQLIPSADAGEPDATTEVTYRALRMSAGIKTG